MLGGETVALLLCLLAIHADKDTGRLGSLSSVPLFLIILFIVVPIAELYVIIQIGGAIGVVPTLLLLLADAVLGSLLLRHQGRTAWVAFNRAMAENRVPGKEVVDGILIIFGGALLLTPGFLTDIFGLILLIPPTRAIVRAFARRFVVGRFAMGPRAAVWSYGQVRDRGARRPGPGGPAPGRGRGPRPAPGTPPRRPAPGPEDFSWTSPAGGARPDDIEGTAEEVRDDDSLPPGSEPGRGSFPG
jgi:UPF0716 protein FxsA